MQKLGWRCIKRHWSFVCMKNNWVFPLALLAELRRADLHFHYRLKHLPMPNYARDGPSSDSSREGHECHLKNTKSRWRERTFLVSAIFWAKKHQNLHWLSDPVCISSWLISMFYQCPPINSLSRASCSPKGAHDLPNGFRDLNTSFSYCPFTTKALSHSVPTKQNNCSALFAPPRACCLATHPLTGSYVIIYSYEPLISRHKWHAVLFIYALDEAVASPRAQVLAEMGYGLHIREHISEALLITVTNAWLPAKEAHKDTSQSHFDSNFLRSWKITSDEKRRLRSLKGTLWHAKSSGWHKNKCRGDTTERIPALFDTGGQRLVSSQTSRRKWVWNKSMWNWFRAERWV